MRSGDNTRTRGGKVQTGNHMISRGGGGEVDKAVAPS